MDGPFTNASSTVAIEILNDVHVDLGFVVAQSGYIKLKVPSPFGTAKASITTTTQLDRTVTATTFAPHNFIAGQPVMISKVNVKKYNGRFMVASTPTPTTFTYFTAPGLIDGVGGVATPAHVAYKANIVLGFPGVNMKFRNQLLTGTPGSPGVYSFTVEYFAPKLNFLKRIRYTYSVL